MNAGITKAAGRAMVVGTVLALTVPIATATSQAAQTLPGSWSVNPMSTSAGSGPSSYVWRYTTKVAMANGAASIAIPSAWGTPQISNASAPDFAIAQKGTCTGGHLHVYTVADGFNPPRIAYEGFKCTKANQYVQLSLNNVTAPTTPGKYAFPGYVLTVPGGTVVTLLNTFITVTTGPAKQLVFVVATGGSIPGPFSFQAGNTMEKTAVAIEDAFGNIVNSTALITITSAPLSGTLAKNATAGTATFTNLTGTAAGSSYPFVASSPGLTSASSAYNITPAPADHLAFDTQPSTTVVNATMSPNIVVGVYDQYGNPSNDVTSVGLLFDNNPRGSGAVIDANPVSVVAGKATFTGFALDTPSVGVTLIAAPFAGASVPTITSSAFDVTLPIVKPVSNAGTYWNGLYGSNGYNWLEWFFLDGSGNPYTGADVFYADDGSFNLVSTQDANTSGFVWEQTSADPRALACSVCLGPSGASWFGDDFSLTETFPAGPTQITVYLVDWDSTSRSETVTFDDGTGLQPAHVTAFNGGAYVTAPISNTATSVTIHLHSDVASNAVISGVFLG